MIKVLSGKWKIILVVSIFMVFGGISLFIFETTEAATDTTPPTVISSVAINDYSVDVKFSEAVNNVSAQNIANYSISPKLDVTNATIQPDGSTVRLTTGNHVSGTLYKITINNVTDIAGNLVAAGTTTNFTGVDTTPPAVISSAVVDNVTVDLAFSESLDSVTANDKVNYTISPNLTINSAILQLDGKTVRLSTSLQVAGTAYNVTVAGVKDLANNTIGSKNTTTFTGIGPDVTPPTIVSVNAINNQKVSVVFSETVDPVTAQNIANYNINPALSVYSAVLKFDGRTVELITAIQSANTNYTLTIKNVQDTKGNIIGITGNTATFIGSSVVPVISPHENFTANTNKCATCHNTHAAVGSRLTISSTQTTLCYLCHDAGGQSKYDVAFEFGKPNPRTSHHKIPEGNQNCVDCHNPHGVKDVKGSPLPAMLRIKIQPDVTSGNSFCLACHQNAMGTTKAIYSKYYPADRIGHNSSSLSPRSGTNIRCEGCHEKHSSDLVKLLKKDPNRDTILVTTNDKTLCAECHKNSSTDSRYLGIDIFNNAIYSKHNLVTSSNTKASFPGVTGQAGQCQNCHDPHGTAYGTSKVSMRTLRTSYEDGVSNYTANNFTLCFQCHNSSSANNKYDIQTQYTDIGTTKGGHYIKTAGGTLAVNSKIPCEDCHSIHGSANNNKFMMKDSLGANLGDGRNQCMACHTAGKVVEGLTMAAIPTKVPQHTDNISACLDCHGSPHQPSGGISKGGIDCNGCHSSIAIAMKSTTSGYHHLMVNTSPTYATVQINKNCLSCHVDHNKFNSSKSSNLKGNYTQSYPTTDNTPGVNTDFVSTDITYGGVCLSCHTSQQAKTYTQPDSSTTTQQLNINNYKNGAHNYNATSTFVDNTTFNANCAKCHNDTMTKDKQTSTNKLSTHNSTFSSILTPFGDTSLTNPMNEKFCFKCHGTNNPNNTAGKDYYGVTTMSNNALGIQAKFTTTTDLSTPSSHNLTKMRCASCHNTHNVSKRDGTGNAQTATTSVYSDPSNTLNPFTTTSGDEVAFCLKCHSIGTKPTATNTATTYVPMTQTFTDPSPNGFTNNGSGWYKDIYTTSNHYNNPYTKVFCNSCHDSHGSTNPLLRKYPDDTATVNGDCFVCHNGSIIGVPNIKGEFLKSNSHPSLSTTAGTHSVTENYNLLGTSNRHAKCEDCHDPHSINDGKTTLTAATATGATSFTVADGSQFPNTNGAAILVGTGTANVEMANISSVSGNTVNVTPGLTKTHASGNTVAITAPTRVGMLRNSSGVGVGTRAAWTSLPANSTTYTFKKSIDNEYEICYKCHSPYSWGTTPPTATSGGLETDVAQQFNPANTSYHPVEAATKSNWSYITGENFNTVSPFRLANVGKQKMYCMDCHGDDQQQADGYTPLVRGPHGSANKYLLVKPYVAGTGGNAQNALCDACHSVAVYDSTNSATTYANYTGFRNSSGNLHLVHRNAYYTSYSKGSSDWFCGDCHGLFVHGQQRPHLIVYQTDPAPYNTWSNLTNFTNPSPGNYSETSCLVGPNPRTGLKCYGGH